MSSHNNLRPALCLTSVAAACVLAACGGSSGSNNSNTATSTNYSGVVAASSFVASATGNPTMKAGYYAGATVFVDTNGNGVLDSGEPSTTTDNSGHFSLTSSASGQLVANITTAATNTASGAKVAGHLILRASTAQIADQGAANVVISPMSSEVQRLVEANSTTYAAEKANLSTRLSGPAFNTASVTVPAADVLADPNTLTGAEQYSVLFEENALTNRYTYATTKLDRGDKYPDALAVAGGDPTLTGVAGITAGETIPADTRTTINFAQAQQAAFNVEAVPRYDNIFVIMLENSSTNRVKGSTSMPQVNNMITNGNYFSTYFATGSPSEPNYTALGGADDFGISDDDWWGCAAIGANTPTDKAFAGGTASDGQPLPSHVAVTSADPIIGTTAGGVTVPVTDLLSNSNKTTTGAECATDGTANHANHNIMSAPNLFTQISNAGMTWRTYSESMNPGQDPRADSLGDTAEVSAYTATDGSISTTGTAIAMVKSLYKTKHHPGMAYQNVRNQPEFFANNRTIFGTQYYTKAADLTANTLYTVPTGYNVDQFSTDLANGDVGTLNFIMPDQCDDLHGTGSDTTCSDTASASGSVPIHSLLTRADYYTNAVVQKIKASPLWQNKQRNVAIVVMFDEGNGTSNGAGSSCCGWDVGGKATQMQNADGSWSAVQSNYGLGNKGHGNSIFVLLTNQQDVGTAPKGIADSDTYSHFSFVRTLQDMFQLADPGVPASYANRSKYTESYIAQNIANLPEYVGSADTHYDSVRPMNHAYAIPAGYTQKFQTGDVTDAAQVGPDTTQKNLWAIK
ncbi:alkaline phosphatase family protein [Paraburkholderia adhaesiva]|uniref:alkaline phosphatase family protein n=1 Tax=Paraburkholderia adhaesiva TaxID=2883244 RepID=UPI001F461C64|nr:alkaline phosphatase family protein [Paraburkholderia adhaesiva]